MLFLWIFQEELHDGSIWIDIGFIQGTSQSADL